MQVSFISSIFLTPTNQPVVSLSSILSATNRSQIDHVFPASYFLRHNSFCVYLIGEAKRILRDPEILGLAQEVLRPVQSARILVWAEDDEPIEDQIKGLWTPMFVLQRNKKGTILN